MTFKIRLLVTGNDTGTKGTVGNSTSTSLVAATTGKALDDEDLKNAGVANTAVAATMCSAASTSNGVSLVLGRPISSTPVVTTIREGSLITSNATSVPVTVEGIASSSVDVAGFFRFDSFLGALMANLMKSENKA